ncbi:MAG: nucleoside hydrolase [Chloroflexota bacterium]
MNFPLLTESQRLARLAPPSAPVRMVLDTDTYNEVDDQFALAHALLSPEHLQVEAIYAAPFFNHRAKDPAEGMEMSYAEILRLLELMNWPKEKLSDGNNVFRGSTDYLKPGKQAQESDAVTDLIDRGLASPDDEPLYVVAIGAITNIASALLVEPSLVEKIVVVWLGGHALHWPHTREFNLKQDVPSAQVLFDSGVPLVQIPCMGVTSHLHTTIPELESHVAGRSALGDYLVEIVKSYNDNHFGWSKQIWDVAATSYLVNPSWTPSDLIHSPILTDQVTWSTDQSRHLIRYVRWLDRDAIFRDLFAKLATMAG